jgi:hypothetical protein
MNQGMTQSVLVVDDDAQFRALAAHVTAAGGPTDLARSTAWRRR